MLELHWGHRSKGLDLLAPHWRDKQKLKTVFRSAYVLNALIYSEFLIKFHNDSGQHVESL